MSLRDERKASDPVLAACAELVNAADRLDPTGVMQARVKRAILARAALPHRQGPSRLRLALAAVVVCGLLSIAAAMVARRIVARPPAADASGERQRHWIASAPSPLEPPARQTAPAITPATEHAVSPRSRPTHARPPAAQQAGAPVSPGEVPSDDPPPQEERAASAEESRLVMAGLEALRVAHDPERAARLLGAYLRAYPDGVLLDEALAYAIEAAVARDGGDALQLANQYLVRFPKGRFVGVAERAKKRYAH